MPYKGPDFPPVPPLSPKEREELDALSFKSGEEELEKLGDALVGSSLEHEQEGDRRAEGARRAHGREMARAEALHAKTAERHAAETPLREAAAAKEATLREEVKERLAKRNEHKAEYEAQKEALTEKIKTLRSEARTSMSRDARPHDLLARAAELEATLGTLEKTWKESLLGKGPEVKRTTRMKFASMKPRSSEQASPTSSTNSSEVVSPTDSLSPEVPSETTEHAPRVRGETEQSVQDAFSELDRALSQPDSDSDSAEGMPFVTTRDMRQQMADLGYPQKVTRNLTPAEIQEVIKKGTTFAGAKENIGKESLPQETHTARDGAPSSSESPSAATAAAAAKSAAVEAPGATGTNERIRVGEKIVAKDDSLPYPKWAKEKGYEPLEGEIGMLNPYLTNIAMGGSAGKRTGRDLKKRKKSAEKTPPAPTPPTPETTLQSEAMIEKKSVSKDAHLIEALTPHKKLLEEMIANTKPETKKELKAALAQVLAAAEKATGVATTDTEFEIPPVPKDATDPTQPATASTEAPKESTTPGIRTKAGNSQKSGAGESSPEFISTTAPKERTGILARFERWLNRDKKVKKQKERPQPLDLDELGDLQELPTAPAEAVAAVAKAKQRPAVWQRIKEVVGNNPRKTGVLAAGTIAAAGAGLAVGYLNRDVDTEQSSLRKPSPPPATRSAKEAGVNTAARTTREQPVIPPAPDRVPEVAESVSRGEAGTEPRQGEAPATEPTPPREAGRGNLETQQYGDIPGQDVSRAELTPLTNAHGLVIDPRVAKVYEADDAKKTLWVFGPSQAEIFDTVTQYLQKNPKAKVQVLTGYRNPTSGKTEADKVITYSRGVSGLPRPSSRKATTADIEASSTEHFVREAGQTVEPAEATEKRSEGPRAVPRLYTYKENGQDVLDVIGGGPNEAFESARTYAARQPEGTIVRFDSKRTNETTGAEQSMRGAFVSDGKGGTMVLLTDPNTSMPFAAPNMQALGTPTAELLYEGS